MRPRIAKRLPPDAEKLVGLSLALDASGSRTEDRFWEAKLDVLLGKLMRNGNQTTLDAALDNLQQNHPDAYPALADMAETHSESWTFEADGVSFEAILIAAPVLAWTRYSIQSGPLKADATEALRAQLQAHVLAAGTRMGIAPHLYSIDQLPRHHVEAFKLAQQLAQMALGTAGSRVSLGELPETAPILADPRFLLAVIVAPAGQPLFRWQEEDGGSRIERSQCLTRWQAQGGPNFAAMLAGCEFECLLPDAYYAACRDADICIRPHSVRTAVRYLEDTLASSAQNLRAVIGGFGEERIDEYRIGFTRRGDNDVLYGIVWPLYGRENGDGEDGAEPSLSATDLSAESHPPGSALDEIVALLKELGVTDVRCPMGCFEPEFCDDCGVPLFVDPLGEIVHAEMPEDAEPAHTHFH
jgi:hypothetical protein